MGQDKIEQANEQFTISRLVNINANKSKNKYAKRGILFTTPTASMSSKPIDLYNQGCPLTAWNIAPEHVKRNEFKIFSTGDAFSILSPEVEINGANVTIHVGVEHNSYSPLVLLHEALQLCRCAHEHGAEEISIALPEQFHPILHCNDFNSLLMKLFKASGAHRIYFYDKNYKGVLDQQNSQETIALTLAEHADSGPYQINKNELLNYLHSNDTNLNLDTQVMHHTRKNGLMRTWAKFDRDNKSIMEKLYDNEASAELKIPALNPPHVLLCCSANKPLAELIATNLRMQGEMVKVYSINGKAEQATIPNEALICGAAVTIVQSTRPNPDQIAEAQEYQINGASSYFFEAAMIARQAYLRGADKINLINPYQFSARSDKAENNPHGKTGAYVQHNGLLFEAAGVSQVITAECHDAHTMSGSYTGKNIRGTAIPALSVMSTALAHEWINNSMQGQLRLVTPDAGATKRTKELTQQLEAILGKKLCESRILGEKQRDSHQDDSARINSLNSGAMGINAIDKYLITDDETATGSTLCQAITNLKNSGAQNIAVIVVHNNMPLDWLLRQLCLARFLYLGVSELYFSDTQEMGTLASSYDDLIHTCAQKFQLSEDKVEQQVQAWFNKNISDSFSDKTSAYAHQEFNQFKTLFQQFQAKITVYSLAKEFAQQVKNRSYTEQASTAPQASTESLYAGNKGTLLFFPSPSDKVQNKQPVIELDGVKLLG